MATHSIRALFAATCLCALPLGAAQAADPTTPAPATDPLAPPPADPAAPMGEPAPTVTEEAEPEHVKIYADKLVDIGLKVGGAINAFNSLGAAFTPELEIG